MRCTAQTPIKSALLATALALMPIAVGDGRASESCVADAMIVFDGSGSMSEMGFNQLDQPRILEARQAIRQTMPDIALVRRLGLIVKGPVSSDACSNIELRFPPIRDAAPALISAVDALEPAGDTPLTESVRQAAEVLGYRERSGTVVLVTDGKETCGGTPCQLAAQLLADAEDLTVRVIGFKVRGDFFAWESQGGGDYTDAISVARCLADRTGGLYISAETLDELVEALRKTLGCQVIGDRGSRRKVS